MTAVPEGPYQVCTWPLNWAGCTDTDALDSLNPDERELVEQLSVDYLINWCQGLYGTCPVIWRPCRQPCTDGPGSAYSPLSIGGRLYSGGGCGSCGNSCSCGFTPTLRLVGPVAEVESIMIDGSELPPSAYRLDNGYLLTRVDGEGWPTTQNMIAPETDEGSFAIHYQRGNKVPPGGQVAAGLLASEVAKALCNDSECQLPLRVQQVSRQGVTISFIDEFSNLMANGQTGIWLVDSWLASVMQPRRASRVYSPDIPRRRFPAPSGI